MDKAQVMNMAAEGIQSTASCGSTAGVERRNKRRVCQQRVTNPVVALLTKAVLQTIFFIGIVSQEVPIDGAAHCYPTCRFSVYLPYSAVAVSSIRCLRFSALHLIHHQLYCYYTLIMSRPFAFVSIPQTPASTPSVSGSSSNTEGIFDAALKSYKKKTKKDLKNHDLFKQLETCNSPAAILAMFQASQFDRTSSDDRLKKWIVPTINVLYAFSETLGGGVSLVNIDSSVSLLVDIL